MLTLVSLKHFIVWVLKFVGYCISQNKQDYNH